MKDLERKLFGDGLYIEYEFINNKGELIRGVTTVNGKNYRMTYKRNEHYVFIIHDIMEV